MAPVPTYPDTESLFVDTFLLNLFLCAFIVMPKGSIHLEVLPGSGLVVDGLSVSMPPSGVSLYRGIDPGLTTRTCVCAAELSLLCARTYSTLTTCLVDYDEDTSDITNRPVFKLPRDMMEGLRGGWDVLRRVDPAGWVGHRPPPRNLDSRV